MGVWVQWPEQAAMRIMVVSVTQTGRDLCLKFSIRLVAVNVRHL